MMTVLPLSLAVACSSNSQSGDTPDDANTTTSTAARSTKTAKKGGGDAAPNEMAAILEEHNRLRAQHCAPPLVWSKELAKVAQSWADELKRNQCAFDHSQNKYGENLAAGTDRIMDANHAVAMWYEEKKDYDFKSGGFSMQAGHFTQLVWIASERLGCGNMTCNGLKVWVCNYDPPGNMQGDFQDNVKPTGCK